MWKIKQRDFFKNCLTLFVSGREKKRAFSCTICFGQTFFWPKQIEPRNAIKRGVSAEIAQNQKWHLFLEKLFLIWSKNWVLLIVFLKSCVFLFFCLFCFFFVFFLVFFWGGGGCKGQVRWPKKTKKRSTSLGPKPSLFSFFCFFVFFLFVFAFFSLF